jgi:hypothetical protein
MKALFLGLALSAFGCAHGIEGRHEGRDVRGSAHVDDKARLLVAGPASAVHARAYSGAPPALFTVERITGDDRDCARVPSARALDARPDRDGHLSVPNGRALCAAAASGQAEVMWHAHVDNARDLWALQ